MIASISRPKAKFYLVLENSVGKDFDQCDLSTHAPLIVQVCVCVCPGMACLSFSWA